MNSTTLMTFLLECPKSVRTVELLGSWDNFSSAYDMKRDPRKGSRHWNGCYRFKNIICDGDMQHLSDKREGGLMMGGLYWYYYRLDSDIDYADPSVPSTTSCPLMPGQRVNVLEVPQENLSRRNSLLVDMPIQTMNPDDKFQNPRPPQPYQLSIISAPMIVGYSSMPVPVGRVAEKRARSWGAPTMRKTSLLAAATRRSKSAPYQLGLARCGRSSKDLWMKHEFRERRGRTISRHTSRSGSNMSTDHEIANVGFLRHRSSNNHRRVSSSVSRDSSPVTSASSLDPGLSTRLPDIDGISEFFDQTEKPVQSYYERIMDTDEVATSYGDIQFSPRALRMSKSFKISKQHRLSPSTEEIAHNFRERISLSPSPLSRAVSESDIVALPDQIEEAEGGNDGMLHPFPLREFSPYRRGSGEDMGRPRSRRRTPRRMHAMDAGTTMLPSLLEESLPGSRSRCLDLSSARKDMSRSENDNPRCNISDLSLTSLNWSSPQSDDGAMQSPTFTHNTDCSSSVHTPQLLPNFSHASMLTVFDGLDDVDDSISALQLSHLNLDGPSHISPFELPANEESGEGIHDFYLDFQRTFGGYGLPNYQGKSDATLTRLEITTSNGKRPTTESSAFGQSRDSPPRQQPLNQTEELMNDFAYLSEAVI